MNTNESANASRLNKIRIVSRLFRVLLSSAVLLLALLGLFALYQAVIVCFGGEGGSMTVHIGFSSGQNYALPKNLASAAAGPAMPWSVMLLGAMQLALMACGLIALNRLFKLFERGIFFTVNNVRYLKTLGLVTAGCGLLQTAQEMLSPQKNINLNLLIVGGLVLLIAWIMDEGRKIQEEQELTV